MCGKEDMGRWVLIGLVSGGGEGVREWEGGKSGGEGAATCTVSSCRAVGTCRWRLTELIAVRFRVLINGVGTGVLVLIGVLYVNRTDVVLIWDKRGEVGLM